MTIYRLIFECLYHMCCKNDSICQIKDHYEISVSQMTTFMFLLLLSKSRSLFLECDLPNSLIARFLLLWATRWGPRVEKDKFILDFCGARVFFSILCYVNYYFVFFIGFSCMIAKTFLVCFWLTSFIVTLLSFAYL